MNASKGTYDSDGYTFAYDYFDAGNPISPLAKLFVEEFKKEYGEDPDFYAANFYENAFVHVGGHPPGAQGRRRPEDGDALDKALQSNLDRRQRVRRRRQHRRHLHPRPDDATP